MNSTQIAALLMAVFVILGGLPGWWGFFFRTALVLSLAVVFWESRAGHENRREARFMKISKDIEERMKK